MSDKEDRIANILNVTPMIKENGVVIKTQTENIDHEVKEDLAYVRDRMYDTIRDTQDAVQEMIEIAKQSQHPRAFEVVANLLNTMREANKDLLDLHIKKKNITAPLQTNVNNETINNNLILTTQDLYKMIKNGGNGDGSQ